MNVSGLPGRSDVESPAAVPAVMPGRSAEAGRTVEAQHGPTPMVPMVSEVEGARPADDGAQAPLSRWLRIEHETVYEYDAPVELAHHLAWLRPRDTPHQRIHGWGLVITPRPDVEVGAFDGPEWGDPPVDLVPYEPADGVTKAPDAPKAMDAGGAAGAVGPGAGSHDAGAASAVSARFERLLEGVHQSQDVWGNWRAGFFHARVHDRLVVTSSFVAELLPAPALRPEASPAWEQVAERLRYHPGTPHDDAIEFTLASYYAPRDPALARFAREAFHRGTPLLVGALSLMHLIHRRFEYRPSSTSVATRAPEALVLRRGVCQDFAHVMLGAMRSIGLAARYVSGYLLTQPPPGQPRLVGADASHAWVEVWCPANGWVALDPTNAVPAGTDHVTLAWGRDYADVAPLRGVIRGGGRAVPRVAVTVEPLRG